MKQIPLFRQVYLTAISLLLSLFTLTSIHAQVQTARYTPIIEKVRAYWEYLPEGYDSTSTTYPLIVSLPGFGNLGDGSPEQIGYALNGQVGSYIRQNLFPKSFTVNGKTFKFIVITPQFIKYPYPTAPDIDSVLTYVIAHYRVDVSRIYLTGLSFGGGLTWLYASSNSTYANRLAAIVPVCGGGFFATTETARTIAEANLPVWAFHNDGDTVVPDTVTISWINSINQPPAPTPPAKMTLFHDTEHDAWHRTYEPRKYESYRENGLNVYEWMLQYTRSSALPPPPVNKAPVANASTDQNITLPIDSVVLNGSGTDPDGTIVSYLWNKISGPPQGSIAAPSSAQTKVTGLAAGTYLFELTVTDNGGLSGKDTVMVTVNPQQYTFYLDYDKDGYGNSKNFVTAVTAPAGYVANNTDCNDSNSAIHPGAPELCDGLDNDCDGMVDDSIAQNTYYKDADNDGYGGTITIQSCKALPGYVSIGGDCNDSNATIHPGAPEICDGIDNDCDGMIDDSITQNTYYKDVDRDGYGGSDTIKSCAQPQGYVTVGGDCNDSNAAIHPGAPELCDGIDNDCNGLIDDNVTQHTYYKDADGDGYGGSDTIKSCNPPQGYVSVSGDCNDSDAAIHPGAPELCDGLDNDCDGMVDDSITLHTYYKDADNDGYGGTITTKSCTVPQGYVTVGGDCNDSNAAIHPGAPELCDGLDNDCDGMVDDSVVQHTYYKDADGDGYGGLDSIQSCKAALPGYVTVSGDCNDSNAAVHPGATEIPNNGVDDNCNGSVDEGNPVTKLGVIIRPNPTRSYFTISLQGKSNEPVQLKVVDAVGRVIETRNNITPNSTFTIGQSYPLGIYYIEAVQGNARIVIKGMKQEQ